MTIGLVLIIDTMSHTRKQARFLYRSCQKVYFPSDKTLHPLLQLESPQSRPLWLLLIYSFQFSSVVRAAPDRHSPTLLPLPTLVVLIVVQVKLAFQQIVSSIAYYGKTNMYCVLQTFKLESYFSFAAVVLIAWIKSTQKTKTTRQVASEMQSNFNISRTAVTLESVLVRSD